MRELTPSEATSKLADAVSIWRVSPGAVNDVIDSATDCLVAGVDSPTLRELAGASPHESRFVLAPMVEDTLAELGLTDVLTVSIQRAALSVMVRRFGAGEVSARDLARWAHSHIGHDGDAGCQPFVDLDDMYDTAEYGPIGEDELDRWAVEEADAFLEGRQSPRVTRAWRQADAAASSGGRLKGILDRWVRRGRR